MNQAEFERLLEVSWQRPLSPEEQTRLDHWLVAHPKTRNLWEEESGLNELMEQLPNVPVASNFTARVLQAVEKDSLQHPRSRTRGRFLNLAWLGHWRPRLAGAVLLVGLGLFALHLHNHYQSEQQHELLARGVEVVGSLATLPLKDFETIQQLSTVPSVDDVDMELLAALQ